MFDENYVCLYDYKLEHKFSDLLQIVVNVPMPHVSWSIETW